MAIIAFFILSTIVGEPAPENTCSARNNFKQFVFLRHSLFGASLSCAILSFVKVFTIFIEGRSASTIFTSTIFTYFTGTLVTIVNFIGEYYMLYPCSPFSRDYYGIESPAIQYAEWQVTIPLMIYLTLCLNGQRSSLFLSEWFIIFCSWFR